MKRTTALLLAFGFVLSSGAVNALPLATLRARLKILDLELDEAAKILEGGSDDPEIAIERGRLALYRGDCDAAFATLDRPDLEDDEEGAILLTVAKGCARGTAATVVERSEEKGVVVRFQDDDDRALFPLITDAVVRIRDTLERDLGTRLPAPVFIDLVRDQLTLSALSGLPERAAQTTGTVAVAKWGRVLMLSPRAAPHGYPWLDTLAHEMTHLVLSQASRDRAPLWLQEGVAKREETRWRRAVRFDDIPSHDAMAAQGIQRGLALPLTELGPSIAMLPSAEQAAVAFAEVASFVDFFVERAGDDVLKKLLAELRDAPPGQDDSKAIEKVSGIALADWDTQWRAHLASIDTTLPPEYQPGAVIAAGPEIARRRRLGELLLERKHYHAAAHQLDRAHALLPSETSVRCLLAEAYAGMGESLVAADAVARPTDISSPSGRWWSLHEIYMLGNALPESRWWALASDPLNPAIACEERIVGELPVDPVRRAICEAAWRLQLLAR
jgi:hypothetical protein